MFLANKSEFAGAYGDGRPVVPSLAASKTFRGAAEIVGGSWGGDPEEGAKLRGHGGLGCGAGGHALAGAMVWGALTVDG